MIYVVFYEIIGDRCNGTYLVNAKTPEQARKHVLKVDEDYVVRSKGAVQELGTYDQLMWLGNLKDPCEDVKGLYLDQLACITTKEVRKVKKVGSCYQLECGT